MKFTAFKKDYYSLPKQDPQRIKMLAEYPHYTEHVRRLSFAKLAEIRARKVDKEPA